MRRSPSASLAVLLLAFAFTFMIVSASQNGFFHISVSLSAPSQAKKLESHLNRWKVNFFSNLQDSKSGHKLEIYLKNEKQVETVEDLLSDTKLNYRIEHIYKQQPNWQEKFYEYKQAKDTNKRSQTETAVALSAQASDLPSSAFVYHHQDALATLLRDVTDANSAWMKLSTIGQSVQGRDIFLVQMTANINDDSVTKLKPGVKYVGNMHGDETVGREMLIYLIQYMAMHFNSSCITTIEQEMPSNGLMFPMYNYDTCTSAVQKQVTRLVNEANIYIVPTMNPDGFERSTRENYKGYDLNRNFPDQYVDNEEKMDQREVETRSVMQWIKSTPNLILSANFHGGAVVASYPYDGTASQATSYSQSPDDLFFKHLAHIYANNHGNMALSYEFTEGITNGAAWYPLYGGMQDWNYLWRNIFEITLELSEVKYPAQNRLQSFWLENKKSLLAYLDQVFTGVKGFVINKSTNQPVEAEIIVEGITHTVMAFPDSNGVYFRLLPPGNYTVYAKAKDLYSEPSSISISSNQESPVIVHFQLSSAASPSSSSFTPLPSLSHFATSPASLYIFHLLYVLIPMATGLLLML